MKKINENSGKHVSGKKRSTSIVLSIFFSFFAWIYTYEKDALKFWIVFALCIISFGYFSPIAWIWAFILCLSRNQTDFDKIEKTTRKKLVVLWSILGVISIIFLALSITFIVLFVGEQNKTKAAQAARQQQLIEDPIAVNSIYTAVNRLRTANGAPALSNLSNLQTAAVQQCNAMVSDDYIDYKNPKTGKDSNSYITDNQGSLYYKRWVSSVALGNSNQTASELMAEVGKSQSTNLYDPSFNSVGWAVCDKPNTNNKIIVGMFAEKADKPITPVINNYNTTTPSYRSSVYCSTHYNSFSDSSSTTCY